jgi:hypothetical protein
VATKKSVARSITYTQFRSSLLQYRHCLCWLWNCIGWNSFLCSRIKPGGNKTTVKFSYSCCQLNDIGAKQTWYAFLTTILKEKNRSKRNLQYSSLLPSNFSKCISCAWTTQQALAACMTQVHMGAKVYLLSVS